MSDNVSTTLTVYHDGQFWVGLVEQVEGDQLSVARIVFGEEPPDQKILDLVSSRRWDELPLSASVEIERAEIAKNPKRRQREAAKELKKPAGSTKAQAALAAQREEMKTEAASRRSQRRQEEKQARFEQRSEKRKQKKRGQ